MIDDFSTWLIAHRTDDPEVADLIARARLDADFPVEGTDVAVRAYLVSRGAEPNMLKALNEAIECWKDEVSYPAWLRDSPVRRKLRGHRTVVYAAILIVICLTALIPGSLGSWLMTVSLLLIGLPLLLGL